MTVRSLQFVLILLVLAFSSGTRNVYADQKTLEYELKAAWLYQFGNQLIDWNQQRQDRPFVIGVFGDYPPGFRQHLAQVQRLRIQGREVQIRQYRRLRDFKQTDEPDILFISSKRTNNETFQQRVNKATQIVGQRPVLIVGDTNDRDTDTMISFSVNPRTRQLMLHRNRRALQRNGLSLRNEEEMWRHMSNVEDVDTENTSTNDNSRD